jgi:NADH:ubiquinone oxidoreductase subunit E
VCETQLEIKLGETTRDKKFTLVEVECLGACVNAPMVQINDDYYEDLNPSIMKEILVDLSKGKKPKIGTYEKRLNSAPISGMME